MIPSQHTGRSATVIHFPKTISLARNIRKQANLDQCKSKDEIENSMDFGLCCESSPSQNFEVTFNKKAKNIKTFFNLLSKNTSLSQTAENSISLKLKQTESQNQQPLGDISLNPEVSLSQFCQASKFKKKIKISRNSKVNPPLLNNKGSNICSQRLKVKERPRRIKTQANIEQQICFKSESNDKNSSENNENFCLISLISSLVEENQNLHSQKSKLEKINESRKEQISTLLGQIKNLKKTIVDLIPPSEHSSIISEQKFQKIEQSLSNDHVERSSLLQERKQIAKDIALKLKDVFGERIEIIGKP